jgi:hypothetical protein
MASASGKDVLEGTDADSLTLWMDGYCKANPLDSVGNSAVLLFQELKKKNNIK